VKMCVYSTYYSYFQVSNLMLLSALRLCVIGSHVLVIFLCMGLAVSVQYFYES
jgi:hypothetical protein